MADTVTDRTDLKSLEQRYYDELEKFKLLCLRLIEQGQPYQVVVLNHELFRFLYPNEPFLDFTHTDPVSFAVEHISNLNALAESLLQMVRGYRPKLEMQFEVGAVETRTAGLYCDLWSKLDENALIEEAGELLTRRLTKEIVAEYVKGKIVLDMGCGSGRYALALAALGAKEVVAVDYLSEAFENSRSHAKRLRLPIMFMRANVLALPFEDRSFDFVFSNGVLHHTRDWSAALSEYGRMVRSSGYLYLYGSGGLFWATRSAMREIFSRIPRVYAQTVLDIMRLPSNRFIFMDVWYVPIENHIKRVELEASLREMGLNYGQVRSEVSFDLSSTRMLNMRGAEIMWGEGEHRYFVARKN